MEEITTKIMDVVIPMGVKILLAIAIYIIGKWIAGVAARLIEKVLLKSKVDVTLAKFSKNIIYALFMIFVVIAALNKLGVNTTSAVAIIGAAGLAIGMALQGSLANFAAGVMIILFKPYKIGDFVEGGGTMGTVHEIQIFNTLLNSPDNRRIIVPNSKMTGDNITNFSDIERRRIDMVFGISYEDDMKKAKEILLNLLKSDERVLKDPAPLVAVSELGDSSVNLVCRPWVKPADYWGVYYDITEKGKVELEKNGLSIPFPQRDLHIYQASKEAVKI
ncbi:MAG: mechanosensitive ion channel [Candidatus Omnitrophica bacterium]|nr:mechanosensitive ion channel [Candidatus Omnitrophota bacterium]MCB9748324.1 mechanosensitive ion channel [Candidatus Omnitrophota bacterium]